MGTGEGGTTVGFDLTFEDMHADHQLRIRTEDGTGASNHMNVVSGVPKDTDWHHYVITQSNSGGSTYWTAYRDGVNIGTDTDTPSN